MMTTPTSSARVNNADCPRPARLAHRALSAAFLALVLGCGGVEVVAPHQPITDGEKLYSRLALEHRAINLALAAPYDTLQLRATPLNGYRQPITGLPAVTFRSLDTALVTVSPDGLLQAVRAGTGARIVAELAIPGNTRHTDTAMVNVTTNPLPTALASLKLAPVPPATTRLRLLGVNWIGAAYLSLFAGIDVGLSPMIEASAVDENNAPITGLAIDYRELTPGGVSLDRHTGTIGSHFRLGEHKIIASTVAYGVARADTLTVTVELPIVHGIVIDAVPGRGMAALPSEVQIPRNGYVFWENHSGAPLSVEFNDPAPLAELPAMLCLLFQMCGSGNIAQLSGGGLGTPGFMNGRQFTAPGVYTWRIPSLGLTGKVTVTDDDAF
jgi:hypothetical protein